MSSTLDSKRLLAESQAIYGRSGAEDLERQISDAFGEAAT